MSMRHLFKIWRWLAVQAEKIWNTLSGEMDMACSNVENKSHRLRDMAPGGSQERKDGKRGGTKRNETETGHEANNANDREATEHDDTKQNETRRNEDSNPHLTY